MLSEMKNESLEVVKMLASVKGSAETFLYFSKHKYKY